ncbi:MAG: flagellar biosynthesis anti-sigma factor FlgM [Desulfobaccales bacterium]
MKPPFKASLESYPSRAERVFAIQKAVQEGSYKVDSTEVANILISHLLNHSTRFHRPSLKRQCSLN